jgi:hypothetical protein
MRRTTVYPERRRTTARDRDDMNYPEGYIAEYVMAPSDVEDFPLDWSKLGWEAGETLASAVWTCANNDGGMTLLSQTLVGFLSTLVVSHGNVANDFYDLSCHVTSTGGTVARQFTRTIRLRIRNR